MLMISASYGTNAAVYELSYDPVNDVTPIAQVVDSATVVALHPTLPVSIRWNSEIARILELPDVTERMTREGFDPVDVSPQRLHALLKREVNKEHAVLKKGNIKAEAGRS